MKILAIIAARGGSKGVPDKNIRDLAGKPLIAYTIDQLIRWGGYDRFVVSTDSERIAKVARYYGADVPFMRPPELARDDTGKSDVLRHAFIGAEKHYGIKFDALLDLDATSPVRTVEDIASIIGLFEQERADCVFSVVRARKNPYFNMVEKQPDGTVGLCKQPGDEILTRQSAPEVYDMNASMYVYDREFLLDESNRTPLSGKSLTYEMDEISAVDIDSEMDFKFVEFLIKEEVVRL